jgi:hypothetical protein
MTIAITRLAARRGETFLLVSRDGKAVGMIEKMRDTRSDTHPWQVFARRDGQPRERVAIFYAPKVPAWNGEGPRYEHGGRKEAIAFAESYFATTTNQEN